MTAIALERDDLRLWVLSAAVVVALHAAAGLLLMTWHEPLGIGENEDAILVDLAPITAPQTESTQDLAPGPEQQQAAPAPQEQPKEPEQKVEEKIEPPPPVPNADVVLPKETPKQVEQPKPVLPPAPQTTAPPKPQVSARARDSWNRQIALQIQRHKVYPAAAIARNETGTVMLAMTINRDGNVVSAHVVRSSGYPTLDQATIAIVHRAAPFPRPPEGMPGSTFDFTIPFPFKLR